MTVISDLKSTLERNQSRWSVNERLLTAGPPKYRLGGRLDQMLPATRAAPVDFAKLFAAPANNPFVLERRVATGIIPKSMLKQLVPGSQQELIVGEGGGPAGGSAPTSVDWRNRWGWPWITSVRDQNGCEACWVFAAVALVEAMVRIEHCVWPCYSEGDVHKGMGATCCQCGSPGAALDWIRDHGIADPGCFRWPVTASGCQGCGGDGGGPYDEVPYTPTPDRAGRSTRIPACTTIGGVGDQKRWLDTVGPLVCGFTVWTDFLYYGSGIYNRQAMIGGTPNKAEGGHIMLIVGYDDTQSCWIVKNSWGTGFGQDGYVRIGYGECDIDASAKIGLTGTNPDPWTKRRMHSGVMFESGNGAGHRNFEMLTTGPGGTLQHWWRDNSVAGFPWHTGTSFGSDAAASPAFLSTTFNRNFEAVHLTTGNRLRHWWFGQPSGPWHDGGVFGPADAAGIPGFTQGNYGAPGNFEVVVRTADGKLNHWWRDGGGWHDGGRFGGGIDHSGATLIQSGYGAKGNFELVCVLSSGQMQHWWRDNDHGMVWHAGAVFGSDVHGPPCMIEGQFGAVDEKRVGNFELCVAVGGQVQHWWRANQSDMLWRKSAVFGHDVRRVLALVGGSYGFNLEVIALRTDNGLQHYWRDSAGWHEGTVIGSI